MANVNEGLQQPEANESVNSESGFAAALAGRGVEPDEADKATTDTSIASGLETVEPGKARDPETGRFTRAAPETSQAAQDTSNDVTQVTSDDPAVAALLAKYDNDPAKALKAAADAQSVIGRQGQQLGTLGEQLAKQQGQIEALMATAQRPAQTALSDEQVEETAANLIVSHGGYFNAATAAANAGHEGGDFRVYDSLLEQWNIESPIAAQRFDLDFQLWRRDQAAPPQTVTPDQWVEDQKANTQVAGTMNRLMADIGKEAFAAITVAGSDGESLMLKALESMPKPIVDLIASNDPEEQYAATQLVADRARLLAGAAPATPQVAAEPELPDSVRRKLLGAGVATAGLRPVAATASAPQSVEDAVKQFKQEIFNAETTSVASGLTYGPQKPG